MALSWLSRERAVIDPRCVLKWVRSIKSMSFPFLKQMISKTLFIKNMTLSYFGSQLVVFLIDERVGLADL